MNIEERERSKYDKLWSQYPNEYGRYSPGEEAAPLFLKNTLWGVNDSIADLGCGVGRASLIFREHGLYPYLVDFCSFTPRHMGLPFFNYSLWNLPFWFKADWIFCVDVLEHIPMDYLNLTLTRIARAMEKGGYLQIACFEDSFGNIIGERLHLIVREPSWWAGKIEKYFKIDKNISDTSRARFIVSKNRLTSTQ